MKKKQAKKRVTPIALENRDFEKEYQELFPHLQYPAVPAPTYNLYESETHIKKFSLFKNAPSSILTNYTISINC